MLYLAGSTSTASVWLLPSVPLGKRSFAMLPCWSGFRNLSSFLILRILFGKGCSLAWIKRRGRRYPSAPKYILYIHIISWDDFCVSNSRINVFLYQKASLSIRVFSFRLFCYVGAIGIVFCFFSRCEWKIYSVLVWCENLCNYCRGGCLIMDAYYMVVCGNLFLSITKYVIRRTTRN